MCGKAATGFRLISHSPQKIKKAATCNQLISLTDFFATLFDLTGQKPANGEGEYSFCFWHLLNGVQQIGRELSEVRFLL